ALRAIETLKAAGCDETHIAAVVNAWEWKRAADLAESVDALPIKVAGSIPLEKKETKRAFLEQRPLHRGRAFKAFQSLASEVRSAAPVDGRVSAVA
ncbi:MAG: hypothetical protein ABR579_02505, partial [Actinomycetota bacterium]